MVDAWNRITIFLDFAGGVRNISSNRYVYLTMTWYLDEAEAGVKLECEILTVKMRQKRNKRFVNYVVSCNYDI